VQKGATSEKGLLSFRDLQLWNRFGGEGGFRMYSRLKCECAEEDFLAHLCRIGLGGGLGAALLVGGVCHHSDRLRELVGGLSQRLVLMAARPPA
jgi:hypothetical protein